MKDEMVDKLKEIIQSSFCKRLKRLQIKMSNLFALDGEFSQVMKSVQAVVIASKASPNKIDITKFEYKKEYIGYRCCRNHYGRCIEYIIRPKLEGGRFDFASDDHGLCEECFNSLPDIDQTHEIKATKKRFAELIAFLRQPGNEDLAYEKIQVEAYRKRLVLLREAAEIERVPLREKR